MANTGLDLQQVIDQNQRMGDQLEGVMAPNGKVFNGLIAEGWGSVAKVKVNKKTGDIGHVFRQETVEDAIFKDKYLKYLQLQFESKGQSPEAAYFMDIYTSGSYMDLSETEQRALRSKLMLQLESINSGDLSQFDGASLSEIQTIKINIFSLVAKLNQILGI
jgi:hypothetical protein